MIKWIKKHFASSSKSLENSSQLKSLKPFLKSETLWETDCQSIARGVAAGLAGCVIPGLQLLYAAILAIFLRGNLAVALVATLVTNPFTAVPITYFIYFIGTLIIGNGKNGVVIKHFHWDISSFHAFWSNVSAWALQFGKAYFIGLPFVSISLGIIGYFSTVLIWKISTILISKKKK